MTPNESAGSTLSKNKTSEKNNRKTTTKHCKTAQSAKRLPVKSQIVCYLYIKFLYTRCLNVVFSVHYLCCTRSDGHRWLKTSSRSIGNVKKSWSKKAAHGSTNIWSSGKYLDWLPLSLEVGVRPTFPHFFEKLTISRFHKYKIVTSRSDVIEKMTFKRTFSWSYKKKMTIQIGKYSKKIQNLAI